MIVLGVFMDNKENNIQNDAQNNQEDSALQDVKPNDLVVVKKNGM